METVLIAIGIIVVLINSSLAIKIMLAYPLNDILDIMLFIPPVAIVEYFSKK